MVGRYGWKQVRLTDLRALVSNLFGEVCRPIIYPCTNGSGYCWRIVCHLDSSYSFLLNRRSSLTSEEMKDDFLFYQALSGFVDAEGYIGAQQSGPNTRIGFVIGNRNRRLLESFATGLRERGINARIHFALDALKKDFYQVSVGGPQVLELLSKLHLRHR